jgi:hypothetical protein
MARPLTHNGRRVRLGVALTLCAALVWGTLWGQDDDFPIGPFRMYSTRQRLDGRVSWYEVRVVTPAGEEVLLGTTRLGLRRAEVEGQQPRLIEDPELLCVLADAADADVEIVEVRLVKRSRPLQDGRPTGETIDEVRQTCTP